MSDLPLELLLLIFDNASARTLISLSLCSHRIRILVFPLLYRHIIFKNNRELSQFSSRVISEANGENLIDVLRVADHVYHLEFGRNIEYEKDDLILLTSALQHFKSLQNLTLHLEDYFDGVVVDYMETLFGFRGLTRLEISVGWIPDDNGKLPSSMVEMIRASPDLITLDLSLNAYDYPHSKWDIDTLFQSVDIAPTTLKLREAAGIDLHAFSDSTRSTPFRSFLLSHHERIACLALPAPEEDFAHGPPSLNLQPDMLPALREFEGTIYWCSQLSKLQVASKLQSLTVLLERPLFKDRKCDIFLEALKAFSSLKALNIFNGETFLSAQDLKVVVDNAPHLESLTFAFNIDETLDTIGSQLSRLNLRMLATNIDRFASAIAPEEVVRNLAIGYCTSLVMVEDPAQLDEYGICWVAIIHRKEGDINVEVSCTLI